MQLKFHSHGLLFPINIQTWTDDKLKWDPSKYGNLQHIHVGNHEVWQPDILLYHRYMWHYTSIIDKKKCLKKLHKLFEVYFLSSGTSSTVEHYGDATCIIYHDGRVLWVPPAQFIGLCDLDLRLWPFDTQICNMTFGSWTYHGEQIDMQIGRNTNMVREMFNRVNFLYIKCKKIVYRDFITQIFLHLIYLVKISFKIPQKYI